MTLRGNINDNNQDTKLQYVLYINKANKAYMHNYHNKKEILHLVIQDSIGELSP